MEHLMVKFECGCIGFSQPVRFRKEMCHLLVSACDCNDEDDHPYLRYMVSAGKPKSFEPLSPVETMEEIGKLGALVADGHKFRNVVGLIKTAMDQ